MQRDRLERAGMGRERERIAPEEQMLVGGEAGHRVPAADSGDALIGLDAHERGLEARSRSRVPGSEEGGIEWQAELLHRDLSDLHGSPP
jgi:hypothetical protein